MNIFYRAFRKLYYLTIGKSAVLDRFFRYRGKHQDYWVKRGGQNYFEEQEAVEGRNVRSVFIAEAVAKLECKSLLEIGCGYGKQLSNIRSRRKDIILGGCDFSRSQLAKGRDYFPEMAAWAKEADAEKLPYADKSFDAVMSSAVILHNKYPKAQRIIAECLRVSRRYLIHNEDTDISFSRYGYDLAETYRAMKFPILASVKIPGADNYEATQFTIAEIPQGFQPPPPDQIPLRYHNK